MSKSQLCIRVQLWALPQQNEEEKYFVIVSNFGGGSGVRHQSLRGGEGALAENQGERRRPLSDGRRHLVLQGRRVEQIQIQRKMNGWKHEQRQREITDFQEWTSLEQA